VYYCLIAMLSNYLCSTIHEFIFWRLKPAENTVTFYQNPKKLKLPYNNVVWPLLQPLWPLLADDSSRDLIVIWHLSLCTIVTLFGLLYGHPGSCLVILGIPWVKCLCFLASVCVVVQSLRTVRAVQSLCTYSQGLLRANTQWGSPSQSLLAPCPATQFLRTVLGSLVQELLHGPMWAVI
jgi:hypothetical protein